MGVTYIQYKIAECDICGAKEQFDPLYSLPLKWNKIEDSYDGLIRYECVCPECLKRIRDYIEEFKALHHKKQEGE